MCISKSQEDTSNWKCCLCIPLTLGTILLGLGSIISMIVNMIYGMWTEAAINGFFAIPYLLVICMPSSPGLRKWIYIIAIIGVVLAGLAYVVGIILVMIFLGDWVDGCDTWSGASEIETPWGTVDFSDPEQCQKYIKGTTWGIFIFVALIVFPLYILILRVLYWGWKQQEYIRIGEDA